VTADEVLTRITKKTRAFICCYPNNPTGAVMEQADWEPVCGLLRENDILMISDEVYAELTYVKTPHTNPASLPGMYERTVVFNGFPKAYAMTGWRLGFACGPADIVAAMVKIHQYVIMCAPTAAQYAGVEALKNGSEGVIKMRREYNARRRFMMDGFRKINMPCFEPLGAFYLFPSIEGTGMDSETFCTRLLQEEKLAVVPGNAFGESGEGYVRCSYAYSIDELNEALTRLGRFMEKHTA
jgi:aminotransferase